MVQRKDFEYNLPLQAYRQDDGNVQLLNYMPRKECVTHINLSEFVDIKDKQAVSDFFHGVAINLLNLAYLFVDFADGKTDSIYYHDEGMDKRFYPSPYNVLVNSFLRTEKEVKST